MSGGYKVNIEALGKLIQTLADGADRWGDFTTRDFTEVVGHQSRHVDDFIRDHLTAFS